MRRNFDILIVGGGLVGQAAALACAKLKNISIALISEQALWDEARAKKDGRAYALAASSQRLLQNLGVDISPHSQKMQDMLITDGALGEDPIWRLHFNGDGNSTQMPQMIESAELSKCVSQKVLKTPAIELFAPAKITKLTHNVEGVKGEINGNPIKANLLIAADGKQSPIRQKAGIAVDGRDYGQSALVATISHSLPHDGLALQRFLPGGPLASLPLPNHCSQIVWSDKTQAVKAALEISESDFLKELSFRLGGILGHISLSKPRQSYPLKLQLAQSYIGTRLALIGDAAHVIHPLAGQGLNLGFRDAASLHDVLKSALHTGQDIGGAVLGEYAVWRRLDMTTLAAATDGLSYLYQTPRGPLSRPASKALGHLRRLGLSTLNQSGSLKSFIMTEAAGDLGERPKLLL